MMQGYALHVFVGIFLLLVYQVSGNGFTLTGFMFQQKYFLKVGIFLEWHYQIIQESHKFYVPINTSTHLPNI